MLKYIHGSEDSLDTDVFYVFDKIPSFTECRKFCSEDPTENRNIITIKNGIVDQCFIGSPDEINNGLLDTYKLHPQTCELKIEHRVKRDVTLKSIRAVRGILSILSRTQYRPEIKKALNSGYKDRLDCLMNIDFASIDYNKLSKSKNGTDLLKVIAFQLGQTLGLYEKEELYTKSSVANKYPELKPFLYREQNCDLNTLNTYRDILCGYLYRIKTKDLADHKSYFIDENRIFDLKHEVVLDER